MIGTSSFFGVAAGHLPVSSLTSRFISTDEHRTSYSEITGRVQEGLLRPFPGQLVYSRWLLYGIALRDYIFPCPVGNCSSQLGCLLFSSLLSFNKIILFLLNVNSFTRSVPVQRAAVTVSACLWKWLMAFLSFLCTGRSCTSGGLQPWLWTIQGHQCKIVSQQVWVFLNM